MGDKANVSHECGCQHASSRGSPCAAYVSAVPSVSVRDVDAAEELRAVALLAGSHRPIAFDLLRELATSGGFVAGAFGDDGTVVGTSIGFLTQLGLHSWLTVVAPEHRREGIATALKWHQREWALREGLGTVTWTFPPADIAAARLSVHVLRAEVTSYLRGFAEDGGDRCVASWALRSAPVTQAWHGVGEQPTGAELVVKPGPPLAAAMDGGCHVVDVEEDGAWLLRSPG